MASGLPDFTSPIDVAQQSLQEVTIRSKYGTPSVLSFDALSGLPIPPGSTHDIFSSSGQGALYGGIVYLKFNPVGPASSGVTVIIEIDGEDMESLQVQYMSGWNSAQIGGLPSVLRYDSGTGIVVLSLPLSHTFETSFKLKVQCPVGETVYVLAQVVLALI